MLDTGIGISADHLPHIFDEFYQVGVPQNRSREGFGLGLSIVERLVKLLDLKLEVSSEPGRGSTFTLALPLSGAAAQAAPAPAAAPDAGRQQSRTYGRRILLVEDDEGVREATQLLLESVGCQVLAAASPAEALEQTDAHGAPDLLISDYHLDCAQTGLDVISALRERFGQPLRVILVSGDTSPAIKALVPDRHLRFAAKPVETEQLLQLMSELAASE